MRNNLFFDKIIYSRQFAKNYRRRIAPYPKLVQRYKQRLTLFINDRTNPIIKDHALTGHMLGSRAFWVTGGLRVIYKEKSPIIVFVDIGTHAQVYGM